jgi:hypothetical protein
MSLNGITPAFVKPVSMLMPKSVFLINSAYVPITEYVIKELNF